MMNVSLEAFAENILSDELEQTPEEYAKDEQVWEDQGVELESVMRTVDAVQMLHNGFFTESVMTEELARQYQVSLEAVLTASDMGVPVALLAPSFESSEQYSTEAASKAAAMLQKAAAWVMEQLSKMASSLVGLIDKARGSTNAAKARLDKIDERLKNLGKDSKPEPSTEAAIHVNVKDVNLIGTGSAASTVKEAQDNCRKAALETVGMTRKVMDVFKTFKPTIHDTAEGSNAVTKKLIPALELKGSGDKWDRVLSIGPGNGILIELSMGQNGRIGGKVASTQGPKKSGTLPGLSAAECNALLDALRQSYSALDSLKSPMDSAAKTFKLMSDSMTPGFKDFLAQAQSAGPEASKAAMEVSRTYAMFGAILTQLSRLPRQNLSSYMVTQWAFEQYLDASVDALQGPKRKAA